MKKINLVLTVITFFIAIYLSFFAFSKKSMEIYYIKSVYYFLIANILLWLFALIKTKLSDIVPNIKKYWKNHKLAVILAFILVSLGTIISKPDFRILADETNLLSMSQALYEERECKNYTSILYFYYGFKNVIDCELDKRPALFPLTVSLFHSFFGYRPENIFVANIITAFFVLIIFYHLISLKFGKFWGNAAMSLLAAYPIFIIYYTSGGFEIINLLFSLILFLLLAKFLRSPSAINTEPLLLILPLLGQTRYESVSAVICILPAIFFMLPREEYFKFSYKLFLIPFLFVPLVWLRLLTDNLRGLQADDRGSAFSYQYFKENLINAWNFFIGQDLAYGAIPLLTVLTVAYLIWSIFDIIYNKVKGVNSNNSNKNKKKENNVFKSSRASLIYIISIVIFYILHTVIRFAYWGGDLTLRSSSRLAILFLPIFVYFSIRFCYSLRKTLNTRKIYFAFCIIAILFVYLPVAGQNLGVRDLTLYREFRAVREYLSTNFPNKNDYIVIADRANLYSPLKYNALSFNCLRNKLSFVRSNLKNRTYSYVLVTQLIDKESNIPIDECRIPNSIRLTNLYETQIRADQFLRISKFTLNDMR